MPRDRERLTDLEEENRRLREQLASLDELPRKRRLGTVSDLKSVSDITTSVSKGIRSIPGSEDRYYLDLYLMQKEQDRLVKETSWIKRRRTRVGRRLSNISKEVAEKEAKAIEGMTILTEETAPEQEARLSSSPRDKKPGQRKYEYRQEKWQHMSINY